jgi:hypothetical protein
MDCTKCKWEGKCHIQLRGDCAYFVNSNLNKYRCAICGGTKGSSNYVCQSCWSKGGRTYETVFDAYKQKIDAGTAGTDHVPSKVLDAKLDKLIALLGQLSTSRVDVPAMSARQLRKSVQKAEKVSALNEYRNDLMHEITNLRKPVDSHEDDEDDDEDK